MGNKEYLIAAIQVAISREIISNHKEVDPSQSYKGLGLKGDLVLCDSKGREITRIDDASIKNQIDINSKEQLDPVFEIPTPISNEVEAIAWAKSIGYPVPTKMGGCLSTFLVVLGLCAYVLPGVIILLLVWNNGRQYERDMKALVEKWIDAGKPEPGIKTRPVEKLEKIEEKPAAPPSTESRLEELVSMKEKGLISQEEYETLRKKALGL